MRRWIRTTLLIGVALVVTSCDDTGSGLVVDLRTDLVPGLEFESVRAELTRADDPAAARSDMLGAAGLTNALVGTRVAEWNDVAPGTWLIVVRLLDASGAEIVSGRVLTDLAAGTRAVTVMITRDCVGIVCGDGLTCIDGECIDPRCSPESPDECPTQCASDSDCTASGPMCVVGRCLDGICFEAADDATCGGGASCNPAVGCVGGVDAGPFDAGLLDSGLDAGMDAGPELTELRDAVEVASGNHHSCARLTTGSVMCWGSNSDGQLGDGTNTDRPMAVPVMGLTDAAELALGEDHQSFERHW